MNEQWVLSPGRKLTEEEKKLVWKKPLARKIGEQEILVRNSRTNCYS